MSDPVVSPRRSLMSMVGVWVVAGLAALVIGVWVPRAEQATWGVIAFGVCVVLGLGLQLTSAQHEGFVRRSAVSVVGALVVMGIVSAVFAVVGLFTSA